MGGGTGSLLCRWLELFIRHGKRASLGFVGATIADVARFNPEALTMVRENPAAFETILRPFAHDIALLRTSGGFRRNYSLGREILERHFPGTVPFYLPPEFMLTSEQVSILSSEGVRATFVNPSRLDPDLGAELPDVPFLLAGIFGKTLPCIPLAGDLTDAYLGSLHGWCSTPWREALGSVVTDTVVSWRDGESFLLLPDGLAREEAWLENEPKDVVRIHVRDLTLPEASADPTSQPRPRPYPVHPFSDWLREFRMLGFIGRVEAIERELDRLEPGRVALWLQVINSDILSAVEKRAPVISLSTAPPGAAGRGEVELTLRRSERGLEGEEYLALLERPGDGIPIRVDDDRAAIQKLRARLQAIEEAHAV